MKNKKEKSLIIFLIYMKIGYNNRYIKISSKLRSENENNRS